MKYKKFGIAVGMLGLLTVLFACSGGDGDGPIGTGEVEVPKLSGTAAQGTPLANVAVHLKDSNGLLRDATTNQLGVFQFDINDLSPPFLLSTSTLSGKRLFSVAAEVDTSRSAINTVNIHPLSDIVVRNWFASRDRDIVSVFDSDAGFQTPALDEFQAQITALMFAIKNLLILAYNDPNFSVPAEFNFLSSSFSADSNGFDKVLDHLTIKFANVEDRSEITIRLRDPISGFVAIIVIDFDLVNDLAAADEIAPTMPNNPVAIAASTNSAIVVWNFSTDNIGVAGYRIFRDDVEITTTPYPVFSDSGLISSDPNCYSIEAFDGAGNLSQRTANVCITLPEQLDQVAPTAASGLITNANSSYEIGLSWTPSQDNDVMGYDVFRDPSSAINLKIATVFASNFEDFNLFADAEYCYKVVAVDFAGNRSASSNSVCVTTPTIPGALLSIPNPPTVTGTTSTNQTQPSWNWSTGGGGGNGTFRYRLDNSNLSNGATSGTETTFTPTSALAEGRHTLYVQEQNDTVVWSVSSSFTTVVDITAPQAVASPQSTTFTQTASIALGCTDVVDSNCKVYYTLDGTEPTVSSALLYTSAINLGVDTTVTFIATDEAGNISTSVAESYIFNISTSTNALLTVVSNDMMGTIVSDTGVIDCGNVCSDNYPINTQIILTSTHPLGYQALWAGCLNVSGNQCTVKISSDTKVSVNFVVSMTENEANDNFTSADLVSSASVVTGHFNSVTDNDYYKIVVTAPGTFYASLSHATVRGYIYLYDTNQTLIANTGLATSNTLTRSLAAGTYYVRIFPGSTEFDAINPYSLQLSGSVLGSVGLDQNEPNDSFTTATLITTSGTYEGYFDTVNDTDYYTVDVSTPGTLYATLTHNTVRGYIYLYDANQVLIASTGLATANTLTRSLAVGTYYVRVFPGSTEYDVDIPYSLQFGGTVLGEVGPDQNEPNDLFTTATSITTSGVYEGYFDTVNDTDYYTVDVSTPGTLYATLTHNTVRGYIYLYDTNQVLIASTGLATANTLTRSLTVGTYYVRVFPGSTEYDVNNPYSLQLGGAVLGVVGPDQNEPNDTFTTSTSITTSGTYEGYFDTVNDTDYYVVVVSTPGTLYATVTHNTVRGYIYLYDANQVLIASTGLATVNTLTRSLAVGTYYVRIFPGSTEYDINIPYSLQLGGSVLGVVGPDLNEPNDSIATAKLISTTGSYQGYYDTVNDSDYFKIDMAAAGTLIAANSHNTVRGYIYLYDVNQVLIASTGLAVANTLTKILTIGTYYIRIFPSSTEYDVNTVYSMNLSVTP